jgi:hypothetical protein
MTTKPVWHMEPGNAYDEAALVSCDTDETDSVYGISEMPAILNSYDQTVSRLRSERDEAVALLRDHRRVIDKMLKGASGASHHAEQALNASDAFLARIDGAKALGHYPRCTGPCKSCAAAYDGKAVR